MSVIEGLAARGDHDEAGRVYTAFGTALHDQDDEVAAEAALAEHTDLTDDAALDEAIGASFAHHRALVGEDVGSLVLVLAPDRTIFGPILATLPTGEQALRIWDGVTALACCEDFYELKRGRGSASAP